MNDNPERIVCSGDTLFQALYYQGGDGVSGMAQTLLRAGVAALLNAAQPTINYYLTITEVINEVNSALATLDRDTMELLKNELDYNNNLHADEWW